MLSDLQKSMARFDGGKPLATRRSRLRGMRTTLAELRDEAACTDANKEDLYKGIRAISRILDETETDLNEAKRIKRTYDQRHAAAFKTLATLPAVAVADVIALAELDRQIGHPRMLLDEIERHGWDYMAAQLRRTAIDGLAHICASGTEPVDLLVEKLRAALPAAVDKHAGLIRTINTMAVAEQLQRAGQPERRP